MFAPLFVSIITLHRPRNITGFSAGLSFVQTLAILFYPLQSSKHI